MTLHRETARYFRDQLRAARAVALRDAEGFEELLFTFERLGSYLHGQQAALGAYAPQLRAVAAMAPAFHATHLEDPSQRAFHTPFDDLFPIVRKGRNGAMHEGAYARHLAKHAVELAILIEDGLEAGMSVVSDFMVRAPVTASAWHPLSFVRQAMLSNAFSFVPVQGVMEDPRAWWLLSDLEVARYIHAAGHNEISRRLMKSVQDAVGDGLVVVEPCALRPDTTVAEALEKLDSNAAVVTNEHGDLLGILTAFDLL